MNILDANRININSPYKVWNDDEAIQFDTDYGIRYAVDFDVDSNPFFQAYWLNLTNRTHKPSPNDKNIAKTIICIIEEFFRLNPDVLLYMCSTDNNQQAQRARLFLYWFSGYEQQKKYLIKSAEVSSLDPNGKKTKEYVALIVQRKHPFLDDIVRHFNEDVQLFNDSKP
jgi:hypothetical protein